MNLEETAIATEYVEQWKHLLAEACSTKGLDPSSLEPECVAMLDDGRLKVWLAAGDSIVAEMTVPRDRWVFCGGVSPS